MTLFLLTLVCALTYSFEIVFGLAGTVIMLAILTSLYDAKTLVVYSALPQILVAAIGLFRSPRTVKLEVLSGMLAFALFGGFVGFLLFYRIPSQTFQMMLAAVITLSGLYLVATPTQPRLSGRTARVLDVLAGASQMLFGISGPVAMTRLLGTFQNKTQVRNYALAFFLALNLLRAGGYVVNGTFTPEILEMMLVSGPVIAVVLWYSNRLHFHVNERVFRRVVSWAILLGGITLFFR